MHWVALAFVAAFLLGRTQRKRPATRPEDDGDVPPPPPPPGPPQPPPPQPPVDVKSFSEPVGLPYEPNRLWHYYARVASWAVGPWAAEQKWEYAGIAHERMLWDDLQRQIHQGGSKEVIRCTWDPFGNFNGCRQVYPKG